MPVVTLTFRASRAARVGAQASELRHDRAWPFDAEEQFVASVPVERIADAHRDRDLALRRHSGL
jgi:hypothetical protein